MTRSEEDRLIAQTEFLTAEEIVARDEILAKRVQAAKSAKDALKIIEAMTSFPAETAKELLIVAVNTLNSKLQVNIKGLDVKKRPNNIIDQEFDETVKSEIEFKQENSSRLDQRVQALKNTSPIYEIRKVLKLIEEKEDDIKKIKKVQKVPKLINNTIAKLPKVR